MPIVEVVDAGRPRIQKNVCPVRRFAGSSALAFQDCNQILAVSSMIWKARLRANLTCP